MGCGVFCKAVLALGGSALVGVVMAPALSDEVPLWVVAPVGLGLLLAMVAVLELEGGGSE